MQKIYILSVVLLLNHLSVRGETPALMVDLNPDKPELSQGKIVRTNEKFFLGMGSKGVITSKKRFKDGYSMTGDFRVVALLAKDKFEMTDKLLQKSKRSREYLQTHLFINMNRIDFNGDGKAGEYGDAYIALWPVDDTSGHHFGFHPHKGVYRYYGYAIHGAEDESKIGRKSTGGCLNLVKDDLLRLLKELRLGSLVRIKSTKG